MRAAKGIDHLAKRSADPGRRDAPEIGRAEQRKDPYAYERRSWNAGHVAARLASVAEDPETTEVDLDPFRDIDVDVSEQDDRRDRRHPVLEFGLPQVEVSVAGVSVGIGGANGG